MDDLVAARLSTGWYAHVAVVDALGVVKAKNVIFPTVSTPCKTLLDNLLHRDPRIATSQ